MKKFISAILFATLISAAAGAQSAQKIAEIDKTETVSYGQFCYLIATYTSKVGDDSNDVQAFDEIRKMGMFSSDISPIDPIPLSDVSLMCSKIWKIDESMMYRITKAPRYAFRQMQALDILSVNDSPNSHVSGKKLLNIITLCIDYREEKNTRWR